MSDLPANKKVVRPEKAKLVQDRVFKRLLESEKEAAQPAVNAHTQLNRDNYAFELLSYEPAPTGGQYILQVTPKAKTKYVFHGKIWVDGMDATLERLAELAASNDAAKS